jgi:GABA(A) receptor-associated protein
MSATTTEIPIRPFKERYTLEERKVEANRIFSKFTGRIPIIVERALKAQDIPIIDKNKYLCPGDLTIGQFLYIIRKRIQLPSEKALFVFINDSLPPTNTFIKELYHTFKNEDGFLYMTYCGENVFGNSVLTE